MINIPENYVDEVLFIDDFEKIFSMFQKIQNLLLQMTCVICKDNKISVVFYPCNHACSCLSCTKNLKKNSCPNCLQVIKKAQVFYTN